MFDAGAVVPAAVEQDDFAARRQLGDIALKIPLAALALGRRAERHDAADARVQALGDALDDAALAGRVAALEDDHDPEALQADPFLQLDELELQMGELLDIFVVFRRLALLRTFGQVPILLDDGAFPGVAQHRYFRLRGLASLAHVLLRRTVTSSEHAMIWRPIQIHTHSTPGSSTTAVRMLPAHPQHSLSSLGAGLMGSLGWRGRRTAMAFRASSRRESSAADRSATIDK